MQSAPSAWPIYVNVRYGFQACYPRGVLKPQGEADNSDGQTLTAGDGAKMLVFGSNNPLEQSLGEKVRELAHDLAGKRGKLTYQVARPGWAVISGNDGGATIFYAKIFQRDDQFITMQLTYKAGTEARYNPVAAQIARCFRLTSGHA